MNTSSPIGVFDSGAGGISVLKKLQEMMPHEDFIYYGDTLNAPYGTKTADEVIALADHVVQELLKRDVKAVVIACNTATAAAAKVLRERYTALPIIGMEPALKLAHDTVGSGKIAVLATPGTIRSAKYGLLHEKYGANTVSIPCPGLMEYVEKLALDTDELHAYLDGILTDDVKKDLKCVVLGCTHYSFLRKAIRRHVGDDVLIVDGNEGTARQTRKKLAENRMLSDRTESGNVTLLTSSDAFSVKIMANLIKETLD